MWSECLHAHVFVFIYVHVYGAEESLANSVPGLPLRAMPGSEMTIRFMNCPTLSSWASLDYSWVGSGTCCPSPAALSAGHKAPAVLESLF